jgi:hypothetical protein
MTSIGERIAFGIIAYLSTLLCVVLLAAPFYYGMWLLMFVTWPLAFLCTIPIRDAVRVARGGRLIETSHGI